MRQIKFGVFISVKRKTATSMKRSLLSFLPAMLVVACMAQPAASPTPSVNEQSFISTAVEMTVKAEKNASSQNTPTVEALFSPTPTLVVPVVTVTELTLTLTPTIEPTKVATTQGPCDKILKVSDAGPLSNVRFKNQTGGQIRLGVFLWQANTYGECGYLPNNPIAIGKDQSYVVRLPEGSYFAWAWITFKNDDTSSTNGNFINNASNGIGTMDVIIKKTGISG
jgi:hypothetical protein